MKSWAINRRLLEGVGALVACAVLARRTSIYITTTEANRAKSEALFLEALDLAADWLSEIHRLAWQHQPPPRRPGRDTPPEVFRTQA